MFRRIPPVLTTDDHREAEMVRTRQEAARPAIPTSSRKHDGCGGLAAKREGAPGLIGASSAQRSRGASSPPSRPTNASDATDGNRLVSRVGGPPKLLSNGSGHQAGGNTLRSQSFPTREAKDSSQSPGVPVQTLSRWQRCQPAAAPHGQLAVRHNPVTTLGQRRNCFEVSAPPVSGRDPLPSLRRIQLCESTSANGKRRPAHYDSVGTTDALQLGQRYGNRCTLRLVIRRRSTLSVASHGGSIGSVKHIADAARASPSGQGLRLIGVMDCARAGPRPMFRHSTTSMFHGTFCQKLRRRPTKERFAFVVYRAPRRANGAQGTTRAAAALHDLI